MQLEDYFDFLGPDEIRVRDHRIGIEHVAERFNEGYSPEEIALDFPGLSLEQVYATITYYLHNKSDVDTYMQRQISRCVEDYQARQTNPSPVVQRLRSALVKQGQQSA